MRGEDDVARELNVQIQELEERASTLDKQRSSSISLISYINDRNRKRNVEDAEKAIMEEVFFSKKKKKNQTADSITYFRHGLQEASKLKIHLQDDPLNLV